MKKSWSFSTMEAFKTCPRQWAEIRFYQRVKDNPGEATLWGTRVHEALEFRVKDGTPLADDFKQFEPLAAAICALPGTVYTEYEMGVSRDLLPCAFDAEDVWCRGIADVLVVDGATASVYDWKTGKKKPTLRQLKLFALFVFAHFPEVTKVRTAFVWLKVNEMTKEVFRREQWGALWQEFMPDVQVWEQACKEERFIPHPSGLCKGWCSVKSCEFCGKGNSYR